MYLFVNLTIKLSFVKPVLFFYFFYCFEWIYTVRQIDLSFLRTRVIFFLNIMFSTEPYAIMPPLELFMEVPYEEKRSMVYRDLERGDIVVGRINNIREYGFFLTLLCMAGELKRDMEDLDLSVSQKTRLNDCV